MIEVSTSSAFSCKAEASDGGSAWGEFHLGYTFDNQSGAVLDGAVKLRIKANQKRTLEHAPDETVADSSVASISLKFFIKDTNGQTIRGEDLLVGSDQKGPATASLAQDLAFDARFEPDRGYYLVLSGRAETQTGKAHTASAALEISGLVMEITWKPAADAKAGPRAAATETER